MPLVTSKQEQICALSGSLSTDGRLAAGGVRREDQRVRVFRQLNGVQHQLEQVAEVAGVAHQHRPEQGFVVWLTIRRL